MVALSKDKECLSKGCGSRTRPGAHFLTQSKGFIRKLPKEFTFLTAVIFPETRLVAEDAICARDGFVQDASRSVSDVERFCAMFIQSSWMPGLIIVQNAMSRLRNGCFLIEPLR